MARPEQKDLFGQQPQVGLSTAEGPPPAYCPDLDEVRAKLNSILAELKRTEKLSRDGDKALLYRAIFPHMTGWLPQKEGAQLRFQFETEMDRLKAA